MKYYSSETVYKSYTALRFTNPQLYINKLLRSTHEAHGLVWKKPIL